MLNLNLRVTPLIMTSHCLSSFTGFDAQTAKVIVAEFDMLRFNMLDDITLVFSSMAAILTNPDENSINIILSHVLQNQYIPCSLYFYKQKKRVIKMLYWSIKL